MTRPAVTVLMPVYNAARYLPESLNSILTQSFHDFELLVINDGSTDDSRAILDACKDPRLRIVDTPNRGVSSSLRLGMRLARAPYLARMDADDVAMPDRLAVQKAVLDSHPQVVVTHSKVDRINAIGEVVESDYGDLRDNIETKWLLMWHNAVFHPTVMLRRDVLRQARINYSKETIIAQDFELWNRVAMIGDFHMVKEVLLQYRLHNEKISRPENAERQLNVVGRIICDNFARYGVDIHEMIGREIAVVSGSTHYDMFNWPYRFILNRIATLTSQLDHAFTTHHHVDSAVLHHEQALLFLQWARSLGPNARQVSLGLLARALRRQPSLVLQKRCWAILASVSLPRSWLLQFERGERGLPAPQSAVPTNT